MIRVGRRADRLPVPGVHRDEGRGGLDLHHRQLVQAARPRLPPGRDVLLQEPRLGRGQDQVRDDQADDAGRDGDAEQGAVGCHREARSRRAARDGREDAHQDRRAHRRQRLLVYAPSGLRRPVREVPRRHRLRRDVREEPGRAGAAPVLRAQIRAQVRRDRRHQSDGRRPPSLHGAGPDRLRRREARPPLCRARRAVARGGPGQGEQGRGLQVHAHQGARVARRLRSHAEQHLQRPRAGGALPPQQRAEVRRRVEARIS